MSDTHHNPTRAVVNSKNKKKRRSEVARKERNKKKRRQEKRKKAEWRQQAAILAGETAGEVQLAAGSLSSGRGGTGQPPSKAQGMMASQPEPEGSAVQPSGPADVAGPVDEDRLPEQAEAAEPTPRQPTLEEDNRQKREVAEGVDQQRTRQHRLRPEAPIFIPSALTPFGTPSSFSPSSFAPLPSSPSVAAAARRANRISVACSSRQLIFPAPPQVPRASVTHSQTPRLPTAPTLVPDLTSPTSSPVFPPSSPSPLLRLSTPRRESADAGSLSSGNTVYYSLPSLEPTPSRALNSSSHLPHFPSPHLPRYPSPEPARFPNLNPSPSPDHSPFIGSFISSTLTPASEICGGRSFNVFSDPARNSPAPSSNPPRPSLTAQTSGSPLSRGASLSSYSARNIPGSPHHPAHLSLAIRSSGPPPFQRSNLSSHSARNHPVRSGSHRHPPLTTRQSHRPPHQIAMRRHGRHHRAHPAAAPAGRPGVPGHPFGTGPAIAGPQFQFPQQFSQLPQLPQVPHLPQFPVGPTHFIIPGYWHQGELFWGHPQPGGPFWPVDPFQAPSPMVVGQMPQGNPFVARQGGYQASPGHIALGPTLSMPQGLANPQAPARRGLIQSAGNVSRGTGRGSQAPVVPKESAPAATGAPTIRGSRPLVPTVPEFRPASARIVPAKEGPTGRSTESTVSQGPQAENPAMGPGQPQQSREGPVAEQAAAAPWPFVPGSPPPWRAPRSPAPPMVPALPQLPWVTDWLGLESAPMARTMAASARLQNTISQAAGREDKEQEEQPATPVQQGPRRVLGSPFRYVPLIRTRNEPFTPPGQILDPCPSDMSSPLIVGPAPPPPREPWERSEEETAACESYRLQAEEWLRRRNEEQRQAERNAEEMRQVGARASEVANAEFDSIMATAHHPFWTGQVSTGQGIGPANRRTQAANPATQQLVSAFERVFDNLASYANGYSNYQRVPRDASTVGTDPGRSRTPYLQIPDWRDPAVLNDPEVRRNWLNNACMVPYMGPSGTEHAPWGRSPATRPLAPMPNQSPERPFIPFNPVSQLPEQPTIAATVPLVMGPPVMGPTLGAQGAPTPPRAAQHGGAPPTAPRRPGARGFRAAERRPWGPVRPGLGAEEGAIEEWADAFHERNSEGGSPAPATQRGGRR